MIASPFFVLLLLYTFSLYNERDIDKQTIISWLTLYIQPFSMVIRYFLLNPTLSLGLPSFLRKIHLVGMNDHMIEQWRKRPFGNVQTVPAHRG